MFGALFYAFLWVLQWAFRKYWWWWTIAGLEHLPPRPPGLIVAANHLDWLDIPVIGASLPYSYRLSWMAKAELFNKPLLARFFREMQCIPVRRGKRDIAAMLAAQNALLRGAAFLVFPEGHRSRTGGLQPGRSGAIRLAVRTGCPIVPLAIWGTEHGFRGVSLGNPIAVRVGKPYHPAPRGAHLSTKEMEDLTEDMMLRIAEMMPEQYWGAYREQMLARTTAQAA